MSKYLSQEVTQEERKLNLHHRKKSDRQSRIAELQLIDDVSRYKKFEPKKKCGRKTADLVFHGTTKRGL